MSVPRRAGERLYESAVEQLLGIMKSRRLRPGDALPTERQLQAEIGVSRNVLRQAFSVMEERGWIVSRRGAGRYVRVDLDQAGVAQLEVASIADVLEARVLLEQQVVVLACQRRTVDEAHRICELAEKLASWEDNLRFHSTVATATHNFMLERLIVQQAELLRELHQRDYYTDAPAELERMRDEHRAIAAAIMARDENAARSLIGRHLERTRGVVYSAAHRDPGGAAR